MIVLSTARVQDAAEALNSDYRADTADYVNVFKEKQKFMCAVFAQMLQTYRRKKYAREHESDYNTQSAHQKWSSS